MLANVPSDPETPASLASFCAAVLSLIGRFDLDPNRALDLVLHVLELQPQSSVLLGLVRRFNPSSVVAVLGFRFLQYQQDFWSDISPPQPPVATPTTTIPTSKLVKPAPAPEPISTSIPTESALVSGSAPQSLYVLAGLLVAHGLVELEELLPYLAPTPQDTVDLELAKEATRKKEVARLGVVSLGATSRDKDSSEEAKESKLGDAEDSIGGNQLLGLLSGLLSARCWEVAENFANYIRSESAFDPFMCHEVSSALADFIIWLIEPIYAPFGFASLGLGKQEECGTNLSEAIVKHVTGGASKQLPQLTSKDQTDGTFPSVLRSLLSVLGPRIGRNPTLFTRICRLARTEIQGGIDRGEAFVLNQHYIFRLLNESLLPGLTLTHCNPAVSFALWDVLSLLPFDLRFALYTGWSMEGMGRKALERKGCELAGAEERQLLAARGHLKRLAKENIKTIGRLIGRHTHSYPLIVFSHMLNQIEAYENLIPYVVDALKYSTPLSRDVLAYALLGQLGSSSSRERLKHKDTHYSQWFISLAKFTASFYRKYPYTEIRGLLHLLLRRLSEGESLDLLILQELLAKMGGCETVLELSYAQLDGMAGGRTLRSEVMASSLPESISKRAVARLRDELLDSGAALPLMILISQVRQRILFQSECDELKLLSHLYDSAQDVLMQFADFLTSTETSVETIARIMPPLPALTKDLGLSIPVAFTLVRPLIRAALSAGPQSSDVPDHLKEWHPLSTTMLNFAKDCLPSAAQKQISSQLWTLFWSLSVYDLATPSARYSTEKARVTSKLGQVEKKADMPPKTKKQELARLTALSVELQEEMETQKRHSDSVYKLLTGLKESLFPDSGNTSRIIDDLLRHCIKDRITLSPADAVFCSQFFLLLHRADTPLFSTVHFIDRILNTSLPMLFACTEYEAGFIGYGISHLLGIANKWVANKAIYDVEALSKSGMFDPTTQVKVDYSRFKTKFRAWHSRIQEVSIACLNSKEYIHIRAALIFLTKVTSSQQYPTLAKDGRQIAKAVALLETSEQRADLQVMARSLSALLQRQSKDWTDDKGIKPLTGRTSVSAASAANFTNSSSLIKKPDNGTSESKRDVGHRGNVNLSIRHGNQETLPEPMGQKISSEKRIPNDILNAAGKETTKELSENVVTSEDIRHDQGHNPIKIATDPKAGSTSIGEKRKGDDPTIEFPKRRRGEEDNRGRSNSGGKEKPILRARDEQDRVKRPRENDFFEARDGAQQGKGRSVTRDISDKRISSGSQRFQDHRFGTVGTSQGRGAPPPPAGRPHQGTSHPRDPVDPRPRAPPPPPRAPPPKTSEPSHAEEDKSSRKVQRK